MNENKLIINFTPTGMIPTREQTLYVPILPREIIEDVHECYEQGITMVHLHARDTVTQAPEYHAELYAEMIAGIRKFAPDLVICISLSGRTFVDFEQRIHPLTLSGDLKPDMGSLTLGSVNFAKQASLNSPDMVQDIALEMKKRGIKPELEVFDTGMINYAKYLIKKELLEPPYYVNLILGNVASAQANMLHAGILINDLPENCYWSIGGVGDFQLRMNCLSISIGGGVRVGLEDNIWYDLKRTKLAKNIDLIRRIHAVAEANEREIMSPSELRKKLHLAEGYGNYGIQEIKILEEKYI